METRVLEANLKRLDQTVISLGREIEYAREKITECVSKADELENQANAMMSMASSIEDPDQASQLYSQADAYISQSSAYRAQADQYESKVSGKIAELKKYKSEYENYMAEGKTNILNLQATLNQLNKVIGNKYGASKIQEALESVRQRTIYNQNLVRGCLSRIQWIDRLCGAY